MKKIFISSTRKDLEEEREEVIKYIDSFDDCKAIAMEKFSASKDRSKEQCLSELRECNALILLIGFKYGSIDKEEGISFTEIEFNAAKKIGKINMPVFVFLKRENGSWNPDEQNNEVFEKFKAFKSRIDDEHGWAPFETLTDLIKKVSLTLYKEKETLSIGNRLNLLISCDEFFRPFLKKNNYFNHTYQFVGQEKVLENLENFIEIDEKVTIIQGRGGIGKSRILFEFSKCFKEYDNEWNLFFLNEHTKISKENFPQLKSNDKFIIVIDDAHRMNKDELLLLLKVLQDYPQSKIIFSCRPYGFNYIKIILNRAGVDPKEIYDIPEIKEMEYEDLEKLGLEVLSEEYKYLTNSLIQVADNSPLVIVVGGNLINEKKISPGLLERQNEFRDLVFNRFEDELIGKISNEIDKHLYRAILFLISSLSPINADEDFFDRASKFLNVESYELIRIMDLMESGILLRRGNSVKITPDILSDHILHKACVTTRGQSTGYAYKVFNEFWEYAPQNLLLNLSELDWRLKKSEGPNLLLSNIWDDLYQDFKRSTTSRRSELLGYIHRVAIFQPSESLKIVEASLKDYNDYIYTLPLILENISYNLDYMPRCCDILWELGKDDTRRTNSTPSHPMRILSELAKYEIGKSLRKNSAAVDFVERHFDDLNNPEYHHSLFDILDELLAKEETQKKYSEDQISFYPFSIPYQKTKSIRKRALSLISKSIKSESTKTRLRLFKSLYDILWPPRGQYKREVSEKEKDQWIPVQIEVLGIIENLVKTANDPIVLIQIKSDLNRVSKVLKQEQYDIAISIVKSINNSFELKFTRALWDKYNIEYENYQERDRKIENKKKAIVSELLVKYNDSKKLYEYLKNKMRNLEQSGVKYNSDHIFKLIGFENYHLAIELSNFIVSDDSNTLYPYISALMSGIRNSDKNKAVELSKSILNSNNKHLIKSLAEGYAGRDWCADLDDKDVNIIKILLNYPESDVKSVAILSLGYFSNEWKNLAIKLALELDIGNNLEFGQSFCTVFDKYHLTIEGLDEQKINLILNKLTEIMNIDNANITHFLVYVSSKYPALVVDLLLNRIKLFKDEYCSWKNKCEPIPCNFCNRLDIANDLNYKTILRNVRDKLLDSDYNKFEIAQLFVDLSLEFSPKSVEVMCEWINSQNIGKVEAIGEIIYNGPSEFVFSNVEIVRKFFDNLYVLDQNSCQNMKEGLVEKFFNFRDLYDPISEDKKIKEKSAKIIKELEENSPTRDFYQFIYNKAEYSLSSYDMDE